MLLNISGGHRCGVPAVLFGLAVAGTVLSSTVGAGGYDTCLAGKRSSDSQGRCVQLEHAELLDKHQYHARPARRHPLTD